MTGLIVSTVIIAAQAAAPTAVPSRFGEWTGRVETGVMAIGGESTGVRLLTADVVYELSSDGAVASRLRELAGREVTLRGRLVVRPGIELRERRIITVTEIRRPTPLIDRPRGDLVYLAFWWRGQDAHARSKMARLPADVGGELARRLARRPASAVTKAPDNPIESLAWVRRELEAALVAFAGNSAAAEARAYASTARLLYEWEGFPDGPLEEAGFAAAYLSHSPDSQLRPYLELFQLHRLRAAFEAAAYSAAFPPKEAGTLVDGFLQAGRDAAAAYREVWERVQGSADALTRALAADIDDELYVYLDVAAHPRK